MITSTGIITLVLSIFLLSIHVPLFQMEPEQVMAQRSRPLATIQCEDLDIVYPTVNPARFDPQGMEVLGIVQNNSSKSFNSVQITGVFFDSRDRLIDMGQAFVGDIGPGVSRPFIMADVGRITNQTLDHYTLMCIGVQAQPPFSMPYPI